MIITKKRLKQLQENISQLRDDYAKSSSLFETRIGDLSREIYDIIDPPKKGYLRFKTINGWVQFKPRKKQKQGGKARKNE